MITVGVQTKGLLPEKNTDEAFKMIHDAGFDCVDINIDTFLKNSDLYSGKLNGFFSESMDNLVEYFLSYRVVMEKVKGEGEGAVGKAKKPVIEEEF